MNYRQKLYDLAVAEGLLDNVGVEEVMRSSTREDLGLTSLNVILLMASYIEQSGGTVAMEPEWVVLLDAIEGIVSVMRKIDELSVRTPA